MSQNSGACDLFHRAIEKETIIEIALPLYRERKIFLQALFKGIDP